MTWIGIRRLAIAASLGVLGIACGGGDPNGPKAKPTQLVLVTPPSATAETMIPLVAQPVVQVADANGRPVSASVNVIASVATGNGTVMSGGTVATDANGRAAFTALTVGAASGAVGPITLQFGAPNLTAASASVELHCAVRQIAIGQVVNSALMTGDCVSTRGALIRPYALTTSAPVTAVRLKIDQLGISGPFLGVKGPQDPNTFWGWSGPGSSEIDFKTLLPAGANQVEVSNFTVGEAGGYRLGVATESEDLTCEYPDAWVAGTLTSAQHLASGDCLDFAGDGVEDYVIVGLSPGETVASTMTSSAFHPRISLIDATTGDTVATATASGAAGFTFANGGTSVPYYLVLASEPAGGEGAYTLAVTVSYPIPGTVAGLRRAPPSPAAAIVRRPGRARHAGSEVPAWVGSGR